VSGQAKPPAPPGHHTQLQIPVGEHRWALDLHYITDPIRTAAGFLILRVEQRHQPGLAAYEDIEDEIAQRLTAPPTVSKEELLRGRKKM
jgi:hypothetical protein